MSPRRLPPPASTPVTRAWLRVVTADTAGRSSARGRRLESEGAVTGLRISRGVVTGDVAGSQPMPFAASIRVDSPDVYDLDRIEESLRAAPGGVVVLAAGGVPERLLAILFPDGGVRLTYACSCPDPVEPCAHAVALAYATARHLATRPADLASLRGISVAALADAVAGTGRDDGEDRRTPPRPVTDPWEGDPPPEAPDPGPLDPTTILDRETLATGLRSAGLGALEELALVADIEYLLDPERRSSGELP